MPKFFSVLTPRSSRKAKGDEAKAGDKPALRPQDSVSSKQELMMRAKKAEEEAAVESHALTPPSARSVMNSPAGVSSSQSSPADSLAGFEEYLERRRLEKQDSAEQLSDPDKLPSPRAIEAPVHMCTPRTTPPGRSTHDKQRAEKDLSHFCSNGLLPASQTRVVAMLMHADTLMEPALRRTATTGTAKARDDLSARGYLTARSAKPAGGSNADIMRTHPGIVTARPGGSVLFDMRTVGADPGSPSTPGTARSSISTDCFSNLSLSDMPFERLVELCNQLLQPLPVPSRSKALNTLRRRVGGQLLSTLGSRLERVIESLQATERFATLPFTVVLYLLENGPCDRGETLFDLAWSWLSRQAHPAKGEEEAQQQWQQQRQQLADVVWRLDIAEDYLNCMVANITWAAECVAKSRARPSSLRATLDGQFSFSVEYDLHDLQEMCQAATSGQATGEALQRQSLAVACGGFAWYTILAARPAEQRFELYVCANPISLHSHPGQATLRPQADIRVRFAPSLGLAEWMQSEEERRAAFRSHWGGAVFCKAAQRRGQKQFLNIPDLVALVRSSCPFTWGGSLRMRVHVALKG